MARPNNGWGSPSMSQDIRENLSNTHHEEEGLLVRNNNINGVADNTLSFAGDLISFDEGFNDDFDEFDDISELDIIEDSF